MGHSAKCTARENNLPVEGKVLKSLQVSIAVCRDWRLRALVCEAEVGVECMQRSGCLGDEDARRGRAMQPYVHTLCPSQYSPAAGYHLPV